MTTKAYESIPASAVQPLADDEAEVNRLVYEYIERERKREAEEARDATADAHIEEKETDAERFARYDRSIDEVIDRELEDDVSDAQRKTIKELTRQYGEPVEIRPSPVFKGYNIVRFDGDREVLAPDGHVMTHDEVMALGGGKSDGTREVCDAYEEKTNSIILKFVRECGGMKLLQRIAGTGDKVILFDHDVCARAKAALDEWKGFAGNR